MLRLLRGVYPGLHHVAVVLRPSPGTRERVARRVNGAFEVVDLLLGERQRLHEGVGYRLVVWKLFTYGGGDARWFVKLAQSVLWVIEINEVVPRDDYVGDPLRDRCLLLNATDLLGSSQVKLRDARNVHVARDCYADPGGAAIPRVEQLDVVLDPAQVSLVVRQPHVLKRVQLAVAHALEQGGDV